MEHLSSACRLDTRSFRPSKILSERSNPALAGGECGSRDPSIPRTRYASRPRTDALGHPGFVRACCHSAVARLLGGSRPTPRAPPPSYRCATPTVAVLRRPPADKSVTSETAATPIAEHRSRHRTLSRTPRNFLAKV